MAGKNKGIKAKEMHYRFVPYYMEHVKPNVRIPFTPSDLERGKQTPLPRSGHRMICVGSNLYVFGGYNHFIHQSDYNDESWFHSCPLFKEFPESSCVVNSSRNNCSSGTRNSYGFSTISNLTLQFLNGEHHIANLNTVIFLAWLRLWKFNTISRSWTRLNNHVGMPNELASHSAVARNPCMIVYGGTDTPFGEASSNSVHLCYLPKGEWTKLEVSGSFLPIPMYGQAVCREKDDLYVVGGTTGFQYSLDVHVLNLKTLEWKYLPPSIQRRRPLPDSRYRHEIVFHNGCLYIFGGGTSEVAFALDSLPTFALCTQTWHYTQTHPDAISGHYPRPRKCHILVRYKQNVYIQGGTNEAEHLNDFWKLDLKTMRWKKLPGVTEKPIYFHSAAVTEEGTIYIFGGIWEAESTRTDKIFKVHVDVPSLLTMAWQAVDYYAPNLSKLSYSNLLELGIPPLIAESLKTVSEVG